MARTTASREEHASERDGDDRPATARRRFALSERAQRRLGRVLAIVLLVGVVVTIVLRSTPWPSAMIIRAVFEQGGAATAEAMQPYVPAAPLTEHLDVAYSGGDAEGGNTTLDVVSPAGGTDPLPTVVWVHGGAWISGYKSDVDPYLRILANEGYTTVALNYTKGPEATYPTALVELNDALAFLLDNAAEYRIDPERIVLAGDSAGANLASQLATLTTSPDYAQLLGMRPALGAEQLVGVILNCGVYDLDTMGDLSGILAWGFQVALWAYTGTQNWSVSAEGSTMSTIDHVTGDFPATYITGGNGDGLTWIQSIPMARELGELGVDVTTRFWEMNHEPSLPHEYQFVLDTDEAQTVLSDTLEFLERVTSAPPQAVL